MYVDGNVLTGWICGTLMVFAIVAAPVACTVNNNSKIEAAVKAGVDPLVAKCAYSLNASQVECALVAAKAKQEN